MKKAVISVVLCVFLVSSIFAAPSDEEVLASMEGVFGVFGAMVMATIMQQTIPGVEMALDIETGSSDMQMNNVDVANLFSSVGQVLDDTDDMPDIPFREISGVYSTTAEGDMMMDVSLTGGPVQVLQIEFKSGDMDKLIADGKSYMHLKNAMDY